METQIISGMLRDKTGNTLVSLAKDMKISRQSLYDAMKGNGSRKIRVKIAKIINVCPSMIWFENNGAKKVVDDFHFIHGDK